MCYIMFWSYLNLTFGELKESIARDLYSNCVCISLFIIWAPFLVTEVPLVEGSTHIRAPRSWLAHQIRSALLACGLHTGPSFTNWGFSFSSLPAADPQIEKVPFIAVDWHTLIKVTFSSTSNQEYPCLLLAWPSLGRWSFNLSSLAAAKAEVTLLAVHKKHLIRSIHACGQQTWPSSGHWGFSFSSLPTACFTCRLSCYYCPPSRSYQIEFFQISRKC